jgi:hypothetical protein
MFQVVERIGSVAYRLHLPDGACIHDVFHVGMQKPFCGTLLAAPLALSLLHNKRLLHHPVHDLRAQLCRNTWHVLIQWEDMNNAKATWEPVEEFKTHFPSFQLEGELFVEGE